MFEILKCLNLLFRSTTDQPSPCLKTNTLHFTDCVHYLGTQERVNHLVRPESKDEHEMRGPDAALEDASAAPSSHRGTPTRAASPLPTPSLRRK